MDGEIGSVVLTGISVSSICCRSAFVTQGIDEGAEFDEDLCGVLSTQPNLKRNLSVREMGRYVSVTTVVCIPFPSPVQHSASLYF